MLEPLLNGILNLFALQASRFPAASLPATRQMVQRYLGGYLRIGQPRPYLELWEAAVDLHRGKDPEALADSARAVARGLRSKLPRAEQYMFMLRFLELSALAPGSGAPLVVRAVAAELGIDEQAVANMEALCQERRDPAGLGEGFLLVNPRGPAAPGPCRLLARPGFLGSATVLRLAQTGTLLLAVDQAGLTLDSVPLDPGTVHRLSQGSILRDPKGGKLYFWEIASAFDPAAGPAAIQFAGRDLTFRYPGSEAGLHRFSFRETGGRLVGIMGGSGAGKSTLLSILNGRRRPDSGQVLVNGIDLHQEGRRLEGVIGYVPQDDLLFEDLSVFQNLYFAAALCLANLSPQEREARIELLLEELNQLETRDLKVGSPLDKTISGGQRKRLNIALELIREPSILFVDEPTSGLSSADSENVMALLKSQAAKGRLVIVVIHQPSSDIFKLFDSLWLLDQGGRPVFAGNPLDALVYFRSASHRAGEMEYACPRCGNVRPEQLLDILEEKEVGPDGAYTKRRRVSPEEWHRRFLAGREPAPAPEPPPAGGVEPRLWRPGRPGQLGVFFMRNLKSRLANRWYLAINLLEPPLLALLTALLCRGAWGGTYSLGANQNLAVFFFISVIVALFLGLSVSAEEINRDRKILERERFLHLSWSSYVASKALYLALVSALQMAVYVVIANCLLGILDLYLFSWLVLFSCALTSCLLGLNVSASLRSAVTIYILIPLLLVPQIMLGGAVVPFDELTSRNAGNHDTPIIADLIPSRWGLEALLVRQYADNRYERILFSDSCQKRQNRFMFDSYIPEARALADYPFIEPAPPGHRAQTARRLRALGAALGTIAAQTGLAPGPVPERLSPEAYDHRAQAAVKRYLGRAEQYYLARWREAAKRLEGIEAARKSRLGAEGLKRFRDTHRNQAVAKLVLNLQGLEDVRLSGDRLVQLAVPICQRPTSPWGAAQFLAAEKRLGPWLLPTPIFDLAVLWAMSLVLYLALNLSLLPRLMAAGAGWLQGLGRPRHD